MGSESELINLGNTPFQTFDLSAMTVSERIALKKKLKIELSHVASVSESIEAQLSKMSHTFSIAVDNCQLLSGNHCSANMLSPSCGSEDHQASSRFKRKAVEMNKQPNNTDGFSNKREMVIMEKSESASVVTGARKCESLQILGSEKGKGYKMDVSKFKQCMLVLNKLMSHKFGWIFNQPVDPVKLKIPDYFSIISEPMDLGTIRKKLKSKLYLDAVDFAADVSLTFSNAMRYNPPGNDVHVMAKELNSIFSTNWKTLESKWVQERPHTSQPSDVRKAHNGTPTSRPAVQKESSYHQISSAMKSLTTADRQMLRKDLARISEGKIPRQLLSFLERFGIHEQNDGRIEVDIDEFDEEALLELHQLLRSCMNPRLSESRDLKNTCEQVSEQEVCGGKGKAGGNVCGLWRSSQKPSVSSCTNGTCNNVNCGCSYHNGTPTSRPAVQKESSYQQISSAMKSLTSADRQMLRKYLARISEGKIPRQLLSFLERFDIHEQNDGRIEVDIDEFDEDALLELHRLLRSCMNPRLSESRDLKNTCEQVSEQEVCGGKGKAGGNVCRLWRSSQKPSVSSCTNGTCNNVNCGCSYHNGFTQSLSSDVDSERSSGGEKHRFPVAASHLTHDITTGDRRGNRKLDSDFAANLVNGQNAQHPSFPTTPPSTNKKCEEQPICEEQLSPSKALRAAMLKSRFADTILKAQQKTLLNNGEKGDPAKLQQEREKLKRKQQEERARIEAQVKAAKAAAHRKAEEELKLQREREREAARLALQKMEKTVDIDENREILKDLEILGYSQPSQHIELPEEMVLDFMDGFESQGGLGNPLEQLGLFIKKDLDEEAEDWVSAACNGDVEEGEIGPK